MVIKPGLLTDGIAEGHKTVSISYADSLAAALAKIRNCALLTGDPEFSIFEKKRIISIAWLTT